MENTDWKLLKLVAQTHSITQSARQLFISQPAATYRMQNIEREFGKKLFFIEKKRFFFTPAGEKLAEYAEEMLEKEQVLKDAISNMLCGEDGGTLRIGAAHMYTHFKFAPVLGDFVAAHPNIKVFVKARPSLTVMEMLNRGEVHVGIYNLDRGSFAGEKIVIAKEDISILSNGPIDLRRLPELPMIEHVKNHSLKSVIDDWWMNNFTVPPFVSMEVPFLGTAVEMVKRGLGYCIAPEVVPLPDDNLFVTKLRDVDGTVLSRYCWLHYRPQMLEFASVRAFVNHILTYAQYPNRKL
jgi:DNA-binding transcriptional LysR family regulator